MSPGWRFASGLSLRFGPLRVIDEEETPAISKGAEAMADKKEKTYSADEISAKLKCAPRFIIL